MIEKIDTLRDTALKDIDNVATLDLLEKIRVQYLGKKSPFADLLKGLKDLDGDERKTVGPVANQAKQDILEAIDAKREVLENDLDATQEWIDVTAPGKKIRQGHLHPLSIVQRDIEDIFSSMGFAIADGPEVETEYFNFDAVNMPADHPARDMQDTFWVKEASGDGDGQVLRTHTTNCQVRYMQTHKPPFRIIIPGRVFRQEATDASHEHTFHQFEALVVGEQVSVANFLHIAESFFAAFFGKPMEVRLRPSYFPFVEPGFEFDISCVSCDGKGCSVCQKTGWVEVGGAGMVHQNVLQSGGYEKNQYTGFAWGFGVERLAMMKYNIDDIRHFHGGDIRFTQQF